MALLQRRVRQCLLLLGLLASLSMFTTISAKSEDTFHREQKPIAQECKDEGKMHHTATSSVREFQKISPLYDRKFAVRDMLNKIMSTNRHCSAMRPYRGSSATYKQLYLKYRNSYEKLLKLSQEPVRHVAATRQKMKQYYKLVNKRKHLQLKYHRLWHNHETLLMRIASPTYRPYIVKYSKLRKKYLALKNKFLKDKHNIWILKNRYNLLHGPKYPSHQHPQSKIKICLRLIAHMQRRMMGPCERFPGSCSRLEARGEYQQSAATRQTLFPKLFFLCLRMRPSLSLG